VCVCVVCVRACVRTGLKSLVCHFYIHLLIVVLLVVMNRTRRWQQIFFICNIGTLLGRPRRRWEDNIKMDLQEVGGGCGDWMESAQDRDRWRALVSTVMNLRVS